MRKKVVFISLAVILIGGISFCFFHPFAKKNDGQAQPLVTVQKGNVSSNAQAIGYIKPVFSSSVKSAVSGTVSKIFHDEGEYVHKGDVLLEVKPEPTPENYAETYSNVLTAIDNENRALQDLNRYKKSIKAGLINEHYSEYISAKNAYNLAQKARTLAEQRLALMENGTVNIAGSIIANTVTSPIDGYILYRGVNVGDGVISLSSAQAATKLFIIADMNNLRFVGSIDETNASKIYVGMPAKIVVGDNSKNTIEGKISKVALQSEQINGSNTDDNLPYNVSFEVEIRSLKIPKGVTLRSGYSAVANVILDQAKDVLTIPERVLHFDGDKAFVLVPNPKQDSKQKTIQKDIQVGLSDGINIEVKSGLNLGDKVIDTPQNMMDDQ